MGEAMVRNLVTKAGWKYGWLVALVILVSGSAAMGQNISLIPASQLDKCGVLDTVWIYGDAGIVGVKAAEFKIGFNHVYDTVVSVIEPADIGQLYKSIDNAHDSLLINIAMLGAGVVFNGPDTLAGIVVRTVSEINSTAMTFLDSDLRDNNNQSITHTTSNGELKIDCTPPAFTCPADVNQDTDPGVCHAHVTFTITATDNFGGAVTVAADPASGSQFEEGVTTVYVTATDQAGNTSSCDFDVTVTDNEDPDVTCPANITVNNDAGKCYAVVTFDLTATDNCGIASVVPDHASGSQFPVGTTTVNVTATDVHGRTDQCSFTVTVNDAENPVVTCPSNIVVGNDPGECFAAVTFNPSATDNCGVAGVVSVPVSGSEFPIGTTTVNVTATDIHGNTAPCSFTVTVNDTEDPQITCPGNMTVPNESGLCGAHVTFAATASDNCGDPSVVYTPLSSGDLFPVGTTTVTATATDSHGRTAQCTFDVTVNDTEDPDLADCPEDIEKGNDANTCGATVTFTLPSATDNCPGVTVAADHPSGSVFPVGTTPVLVTATDAHGNTATCTFSVTINDTQNPTIACPVDKTVGCTGSTDSTNTGVPTVGDNCGVASVAHADVQNVNIITRTWTVTDTHGNQATCTQTITIGDFASPTMQAIVPAPGGYYNMAPVLTTFGFTDDCGLDDISYQMDGFAGTWIPIVTDLPGASWSGAPWSVPGFAGLSEGTHTVYFKATDDVGRANGNGGELNWQFFKDTQPPEAPTGLSVQPGNNKISLSWTNAPSDYDHTVIMRTGWYSGGSGYPEYDDANPEGPYPADTVIGFKVYSGTVTSFFDVYLLSPATRDVYHYAAFTVDKAGNVSTASAQGRATSYWLGDKDCDGAVYWSDLGPLSNAYWTHEGDGQYLAEFDIGPTVTNSPKGIPTTDNAVNFEDLVIFAINYNTVAPLLKMAPVLAGSGGTGPLEFELIQSPIDNPADPQTAFTVVLKNNPGTIKAIHCVIAYDPAVVEPVGVGKSAALENVQIPVFFDGRERDGRVDISMALLGGETTIGGSGELATITFRRLQPSAVLLDFADVDIRDAENNRITAASRGVTAPASVPMTYALSQNIPNPFNPETRIAYQLPQSGHVTLRIYNIQGQSVRTLVDDSKPAGYHTVVWDGTDEFGKRAASGIYFYRMASGDFNVTRKMVLLK